MKRTDKRQVGICDCKIVSNEFLFSILTLGNLNLNKETGKGRGKTEKWMKKKKKAREKHLQHVSWRSHTAFFFR